MRKIYCVIIMSRCEFESQTTVNLTISIWSWPHSSYVALVLNLVWAKISVASKDWCVLVSKWLLEPLSLIICNILTTPLPSNFMMFCILDRISQWSHSSIICWLGLHEVNYIYSISLIFPGVLNSEVVPLGKTACSIIIFKKQFVFKFTNFHNFS